MHVLCHRAGVLDACEQGMCDAPPWLYLLENNAELNVFEFYQP